MGVDVGDIFSQAHGSTASLGLGMYPNDGEDAESLVANVDAAMYRAKEMGRNNFQFFTRPAAEAGGVR